MSENTEDTIDERSWLRQFYTDEKFETESYYDTFDDFTSSAELDAYDADLTLMPLDKYQITGSIGQGGGKTILTIKDKDTTRHLAMAIIRDEDRASVDKIKRFIREARITAAMEHPNIVPVHDIGLDDEGKPYFTMKLIEGEDLYEIIRKLDDGKHSYSQRYSLPYLLNIFESILNAIAYAHSKGIVHLDLKPSNVRISDYGEVLVVDWGLARFVKDPQDVVNYEDVMLQNIEDTTIEVTQDGIIKGSPGFMAPEQASADEKHKDERTDIYSLGAILYSILTYKRPISGNDVHKILKDTRRGNIMPPRQRVPRNDIPSALDAICMKAMSTNPKNRYQTVEEFSDDIKKFSRGFATSAEDVGVLTLLWLMFKRHQILFTLVFSSMLIITFLGAMAINKARVAENERSKVEGLLADKVDEQEKLQAEKEKLDEAIKQIEFEQEARRSMETIAFPSLIAKSREAIETYKLSQALIDINGALDIKPDNEEALTIKGFILLSQLKCNDAISVLNKAKRKVLVKVLLKYATFQNSQEQLTDSQLISLIKDIRNSSLVKRNYVDKNALIQQLCYQVNRRHKGHLEKQIQNSKTLMTHLNPRKKDLRVSYEIKKYNNRRSLKIMVQGQSVRSIQALVGLPIFHLDISGTSVSDINALKGSTDIRYLIIADTPIESLPVFRNTAPMHELNITNCNIDLRTLTVKARKIVASKDVKGLDGYRAINKKVIFKFAEN